MPVLLDIPQPAGNAVDAPVTHTRPLGQKKDNLWTAAASIRQLNKEKAKKYTKLFLGLIMGFCSFWIVWGQIMKFLEGSTTITQEKQPHMHLSLPKVALCMKQRFKYKALAEMGLPEDYFSEMKDWSGFDHGYSFPDLNETWLKSTWSREDMKVAVGLGSTHTSATLLSDTEGMCMFYFITWITIRKILTIL